MYNMKKMLNRQINIINSKSKQQGISLIVLVITILVVIVLAGSVILTISKNNPLSNATQAVFQSDLKNLQSELQVSITSKILEQYNVDYTEFKIEVSDKSLLIEFMPSIKNTDYLKKDLIAVENGKLVLVADKIPDLEKAKLIEWARQIDIGTI